MLDNSITDGALYAYRDPQTGEGDGARMLEVLWNFWSAVAQTWPDAWSLPPRKSRLTHGVGIVALGYVMDEVTESLAEGEVVPSADEYAAELACLRDACAWTRGQWEFGLRDHRA